MTPELLGFVRQQSPFTGDPDSYRDREALSPAKHLHYLQKRRTHETVFFTWAFGISNGYDFIILRSDWRHF